MRHVFASRRARSIRLHSATVATVSLLVTGCCQTHRVWFQDTGARPVRLSDVQEPATRVALVRGRGYELAPTNRDRSTELFGRDRNYLLVDVGALNPIVAFSNRAWSNMASPDQAYTVTDTATPPPPDRTDGRWAVQLSTPLAVHLFWDPFTDNNPILNTDYTFGVDVAARRALRRNLELRVGGSYSHISTHLGDEYVIANSTAERGPFPFDRVNVSYWPVRGWTSMRWYVEEAENVKWIAEATLEVERIGAGGHYELFPNEADPARVPLTPATTEPSATLEIRQGKGSRLKPESQKLSGYWRGAVTVANRTVFPYHNGLTRAEKALQANAVVGYVLPYTLRLNSRQVMLYGRAFTGPNPFGQFRNQRSTWFAGIGAAFAP